MRKSNEEPNEEDLLPVELQGSPGLTSLPCQTAVISSYQALVAELKALEAD